MTQKNSPATKIIWSGFFLRLFFLLILLIIGYISILLFNINKNIPKITLDDQSPTTNNLVTLVNSTINKNDIKLKGEKNNRINILLLGIDGGERKGKYLTDTIALVSINPNTYQSAILSIPRDLYVQIPNSTYHTKINALYTYGIRNKNLPPEKSAKLITKAVEEITGQDIHYHIILDFVGFKKIINILEGINITVEDNIYDDRYPGPNYSYETFAISKGFHHLDAETALKYARVRHTKGGDFGRAHRQQQIIASAREKALTLKILINPKKIISLIDTLGNHLKTNISIQEIPSIIALINNINIHQATTKVLDAWSTDSLLKSTHIPLGGVSAYVLIPKAKSYIQIRSLSKNIFNLNKLKDSKIKIQTENAKIQLLSPDYKTFISFRKTLLSWGYHITTPYAKSNYPKHCASTHNAILSYTDKKKIFTLNDLAEKLNLKIMYVPQLNTSSTKIKNNNNKPDIILCISKDTAEYFNVKQEPQDYEPNNSQEILNKDGEVFISK